MFKCYISHTIFLLILISTGIKTQDNNNDSVKNGTLKCIVPSRDMVKNGITNVDIYDEQPQPGTILYSFVLEVTCNTGYTLLGKRFVQCIEDRFHDPLPKCVAPCKSKSPELLSCGMGFDDEEAQCLITRSNLPLTSKNSQPLTCGRPGEVSFTSVANGTLATLLDAPWHAGVYRKITKPYMQICGGTIISANVVISAAHCFWSDLEKKLPAGNFAVAFGKLYRPWDNDKDTNTQKSDIKEIRIPPRFQGSATNFQDDIAALILTTPIMFTSTIVPACLDFDYNIDVNQLTHGTNGRVVGWGLTSADGAASQVLNKAELPVVAIEQCIAQAQPEFLESITSDKICAGYNNGTSVCRGDSGGGLAFPQFVDNFDRYYLRGVVSTAPTNDHACNVYAVATFTHIIKHEHFIKKALEGNSAPEFEVTTPNLQTVVDEVIDKQANKEIVDRLNANRQTTNKPNAVGGTAGIAIIAKDPNVPVPEYKPSVFIPLEEYLASINSTIKPCYYSIRNFTACKNATHSYLVASETEAPITNPPPASNADTSISTENKFNDRVNNQNNNDTNQSLNTEVLNQGELNNQKDFNAGVRKPELNVNKIINNQTINQNQGMNKDEGENKKETVSGLNQGELQNKNGVDKEGIREEGNPRLPLIGGVNVPYNGAINQAGVNQGVLNPLILNQGVQNPIIPNQVGLNQGNANKANPNKGNINDKVSIERLPNTGSNVEDNRVSNGVLNQDPINPEIQKVPFKENLPQNGPNQGVLNPEVINPGVLHQAVPNQQVNNNLPSHQQNHQNWPTNNQQNHQNWHDSLNNQDNHQNWPTNNQQNHQNWHHSPNNQDNHQNWPTNNQQNYQNWHHSPNNQDNHQHWPTNNQQNYQNWHDSPNNENNHQNWHYNWHNTHDHQYNWHQNWNYQHKPQGHYDHSWQGYHQDGQ